MWDLICLSIWKKFTWAGNRKFEREMNRQNEVQIQRQVNILCALPFFHLSTGDLQSATSEVGRRTPHFPMYRSVLQTLALQQKHGAQTA